MGGERVFQEGRFYICWMASNQGHGLKTSPTGIYAKGKTACSKDPMPRNEDRGHRVFSGDKISLVGEGAKTPTVSEDLLSFNRGKGRARQISTAEGPQHGSQSS